MVAITSIPSQLSILVVSDAGTVRDILSHGLKSLGLKDIEYRTEGMAALRYLRQRSKVDIVICEKDLSDVSGLEVIREITEADDIQTGSVILLSNSITPGDVALAAELGCDGYLVKPFSLRDLALKICQAVSRAKDPACLDSRIRIAKNFMVKGQLEAAVEAYETIRRDLKQQNPSARVAVGLGRCFRKLSNTEAAFREFGVALKANPKYIHAHQELGLCFLDVQESAKAIEEFDHAIGLSPNNPIRYDMVAELLFKAGDYVGAENYLMRAIQLELAYPDLYAQLARALFAQKKPERAAQFLEKALLREPKNTSFLNSLGICYRELGKVDLALDKYNQALKINPEDVKVLFNKSLCLIFLEEFDRAQKTLEFLLRLDPSYTKAVTKLAELPKLREAAVTKQTKQKNAS